MKDEAYLGSHREAAKALPRLWQVRAVRLKDQWKQIIPGNLAWKHLSFSHLFLHWKVPAQMASPAKSHQKISFTGDHSTNMQEGIWLICLWIVFLASLNLIVPG